MIKILLLFVIFIIIIIIAAKTLAIFFYKWIRNNEFKIKEELAEVEEEINKKRSNKLKK